MIYKILGAALVIIGAAVALLGILSGFGGANLFSLLRIELLGLGLLVTGLRFVLGKRN